MSCPAGHRFDRAREGYLNLLVGGRKRGRPPGDTDEMLRARRRFLDGGWYAKVGDAVAAAVAAALAGGAEPDDGGDVLDLGCGEGWYLSRVAVTAPEVHRWGIDVAKTAVRLAARRDRTAGFAVASAYRLPVATDTVDVALSVFAPRPFEELRRVLRPGGAVVLASPGPDHLAGLAELIYASVRPHDERPHTGATDDARFPPPVASTRVRFELVIDGGNAVHDLLQMTPYWWKATDDQRQAIGALDHLTTTVDVIVATHRLAA